MMSGGNPDDSGNEVLKLIASGNHRAILRFLLENGSSVREQELANHLLTIDKNKSTTSRTHSRDQPDRIELYHILLPQLADFNLVSWDNEAGIIEKGAHPALDDQRFRQLLQAEIEGFDEALAHIANKRNRVLLTILKHADTSMTLTDLARELVRADASILTPDPQTVKEVLVPLYHIHLPALDNDGLVEFDIETGRATYVDHPGVEEIFTIILEPETHLADSGNEFFQGLGNASQTLNKEINEMANWPHSWGNPCYD